MNDLVDRLPVQQDEKAQITFHMVSGDIFNQTIDDLDHAQSFMDWYRNPGKCKVWAWHCVADSEIHLFKHDQIMAVDIEGYIEPEGRSSRWYERFFDRIRARWL